MEIISAIRERIVPDTFLLDVHIYLSLLISVLQEDLHYIPRPMVVPKAVYVAICDDCVPDIPPRNQQSLPPKTLLLPCEREHLEYGDIALYSLSTLN
jgi:hypothetical protein